MAFSNARIATVAGLAAAGMLGLAFASEPLYRAFCQITGYGGTTRIASQPASEILDQTVEIRFDANAGDTPLHFRPLQGPQTVRIGQHGLAFYEVTNPTDRDITVIATYNVTPHLAGPYFYKLECFCFSERVIGAGETRKLPVVYFVSPAIVEDRVASRTGTITLSYTFFNSTDYSGPRREAAANPASPG